MDQIYLVCLTLGSAFLVLRVIFLSKSAKNANIDSLLPFKRPFTIALLFGIGGMLALKFVNTELLRFFCALVSAMSFPLFDAIENWGRER